MQQELTADPIQPRPPYIDDQHTGTAEREELVARLQAANVQLQVLTEELEVQTEELKTQNDELAVANQTLEDERGRWKATVENMLDLVTVANASGQATYMNPAYSRWIGREIGQNLTFEDQSQYYQLYKPDGAFFATEDLPLQRAALLGEDVRSVEVVQRRLDGEKRIAIWNASPLRDTRGRITGAVAVGRDVTEQVRARERMAYLAEASNVLASSLDYQTTLDSVARLAVPVLADWASVEMLDAEGVPQQVALVHPDPAKREMAREWRRRYPIDPRQPGAMPTPLTTGESLLVPDIPDTLLEVLAPDPDMLRNLCELGLKSAMFVPLKIRGDIIGMITFVAAHSGRRYGPDDLSLAEELARRAALAIDNARLYAAELEARRAAERVADRMQRLQAVSSVLSAALTPTEVAEVVVREGLAALGANAGLVMQVGENQTLLEIVQSIGYAEDIVDYYRRFPISASNPVAEVVRTGKPVWLESSGEYATRYTEMTETRAGAGLEAAAFLPLVVARQRIGALAISFYAPREFSLEDRAFILALAQQCAQALRRAQLSEQRRRLAALEERQRLARELHDSLSQALYGIALGVKTARTLLDQDTARLGAPLDYVLSLAGAGLAEMRALIFDLRPESLETEGLIAGLRKQAESMEARHRINVAAELGEEPDLPVDVKETLYSIAREALHNTVKHAAANNVVLRLATLPNRVVLEIGDDGAGFDPNGSFPGHLGLQSMRERAGEIGGTLTIDSAPARGTHVHVEIPVA